MEVGTVVVTVQTYGTFHSIWVRRSGAEVSMPRPASRDAAKLRRGLPQASLPESPR
jgi:hypothetical protein